MITVGIPTKNRYPSLAQTLLSIALQKNAPIKEVIIIDDSDVPQDVRNLSYFNYILQLLNSKGINWKILFGKKQGQHYSHQAVQDMSETEFVFRIDDDEVAEPDALEKLLDVMKRGPYVGAVAPAVMMPNPAPLSSDLKNTILTINSPNVQWFKGSGVSEAEHLYSSFMYRKGIASFDLNLSTVAHREETIFTHSLFRRGFKLFVNHDAHVWHFREEEGGIRTFKHDASLWDSDEKIFRSYLNLWGVSNETKYVVLDNGLGDHYAFKNILPELRKKYPHITIACCFPDIFFDEDMTGLKLISIAEAKLLLGHIDNFSVYRFMIDRNWKENLVEAYKSMYL